MEAILAKARKQIAHALVFWDAALASAMQVHAQEASWSRHCGNAIVVAPLWHTGLRSHAIVDTALVVRLCVQGMAVTCHCGRMAWRSRVIVVTWHCVHASLWSHGMAVTLHCGHMALWSSGIVSIAFWSRGIVVQLGCWNDWNTERSAGA